MMVCPFAQLVGSQEQASACPFAASTNALAPGCPVSAEEWQAVAVSPSAPTASQSNSCDDEVASSSSNSSVSSSSSSSYVHQAWQLKRPVVEHDPKLTRRQLRKLGRSWSLADVAQHKYCDDGWIAVDGKVYDITEHIATHPGWDSGCRVTEVLSILAHLGCDCSEEFHEIHRAYPVSYKQLAAYYIGDLQPSA